ncbi:MAG: sugar nucleotide-binding protein [Candidatus Woesearchaeota archaeon]
MKRLLVIGGSGFLGYSILESNKEKYECYGTYLNTVLEIEGVKTIRMDLKKRSEATLLLSAIEPEAIIYAAKLDNESEIVGYLADEAKRLNCRLIFMSSGAVFDGKKGEYKEDDAINPLTEYGKGKAESEKIIKARLKDYAIIRTSYIYGANSRGYDRRIKEMLEAIKSGKPFPRYVNIYKSPIFVDDLAEYIIKVAESDYSGIIHIAGERVSAYEFFKRVAGMMSISSQLVHKEKAERESDNSLNCSKAKKLFGFAANRIEDCIATIG